MKISNSLIRLNIVLLIFAYTSSINAAAISWTGSVNQFWSNPGNWNSGTVPELGDEVFISGPIAYTIVIDGKFDCRRLQISSNVHNVYIQPGASLNIDGQNIATTDLLSIASTSNMENDGFLLISNLTTALERELLDVDGTFTNRENATLKVEYMSFTGTNSGDKNREAINIGNDGIFINEGIIDIDHLPSVGFTVNGSLRNESTGVINLKGDIDKTGIILVDGTSTPSFHNYGKLFSIMNKTSQSKTIWSFQDTEIFNHNLIRVTGSILPAKSINLRGDFTNFSSAHLEFINSSGVEYGFPNSGVMQFLNQGIVSLSNPGSAVGTAFSIRDGATVNNQNTIAISGYAVGMGTTQNSNLENQDGANVTISGTVNSGFNNVGEVNNYGMLNVIDCGSESYRNLYSTVNFSTGIMNIVNANGGAIRNARAVNSSPHANFQNYGQLNISVLNGDIAILNYFESLFRQEGKIDIVSASIILNLGPAKFLMKDTINAVEFINAGILELIPSAFPYVFNGDLTLLGTGIVDYYVSSSNNTRQIKVLGDLLVDGDLDLEFESGYVPGPFHNIDIIEQTGSRIGFFENFYPEFVLNDHQLSYSDPKIVKLSYNSCSNTIVENRFLFTSGNWSAASNWSQGHVPFSCEEVVIQPAANETMTISMNSVSSTIEKLTIFNGGELIIEEGKTLTINREFKEHIGKQALFIYEGGKISNHGILIAENVDGGSIVENQGEIVNDDIFRIRNGYNSGLRGMTNGGSYRNTGDGLLVVSNLDAGPNDSPEGIWNSDTFVENGFSEIAHNFYNRSNGQVFGNGSISTPFLNNIGIINPGEDLLNDVGDLTIEGDLEMETGSKLIIDVAGTDGPGYVSGHDRITISMNAELVSEVEFVLKPNFEPTPTDQFPFLYYQSNYTGNFSVETYPSEIATWEIADNGTNQLILIYAESCLDPIRTWTGNGFGDDWTNGRNWSNDIEPRACHEVYVGPTSTVVIPDFEEVDAASLDIESALININKGALLTLHGDSPLEASLNLVKTVLTNEGEINIAKTVSKPSIKIDQFTKLTNGGDILIK